MWVFGSIPLLLILGLAKNKEYARKLSIVFFVLVAAVMVFAFFPMNIESEKSIFWEMRDSIKIPLFLCVQALVFLTVYSLRDKFKAIDQQKKD